ncbi:sulfite exporter TauE/SafE family protein [Orrella sp. JC864]|uniref:TSUP family transporter n=1 Tax=Orrella sp. JC864 TaxID=3120298 RepID=UPI0012BCE314
MSLLDHVIFLLCVALATGAQTLTGFAFGLVLLGLTSVLAIAPLVEVTNVISILVLANLAALFARRRPVLAKPQLLPAVAASLLCVPLGVWLLHRFSADAAMALQMLLGATILGCALLLGARSRPFAQVSGAGPFAAVGALSGVLGGLFSASGPPIVYLFYRQPLPLDTIRHSLVVLFAANSLWRLLLMVKDGAFTLTTVWMSLQAIPVVIATTWLVQRYGPIQSVRLVRRLVLLLLAAAGLGLLGQGAAGFLR